MKTPDLPTVHWRTSTHSGAEGGDCVEVAILASLTPADPHPEDESTPMQRRPA
jgi:hypothetical protein